MELQTANVVTIFLAALVLPSMAFVLPPVSVCRGCLAHDQQRQFSFFATTAVPLPAAATPTPPSGRRPRSSTSRLRLRRDELPEESLRQLEAGDMHVKELEEEYWKSLDADEVAVERKCASGLVCLKMCMLERAAEDYTQAAELGRPNSRTWPLGLVLYYCDRYEEAVVRLDTDVRSFETVFEESATDERIWQAAAMIRGARAAGADVAQVAAGLPPLEIPEPNNLRRTVYEMFRGTGSPNDVATVAKLEVAGMDYLGVEFFSDFFLGLWHDAHGHEAEAEKYILSACRNKYPQPDDLWYHTPRVHASARQWELLEE